MFVQQGERKYIVVAVEGTCRYVCTADVRRLYYFRKSTTPPLPLCSPVIEHCSMDLANSTEFHDL